MWLFIFFIIYIQNRNVWILTIQEITPNEYRDSGIVDKKDIFLKSRIMLLKK